MTVQRTREVNFDPQTLLLYGVLCMDHGKKWYIILARTVAVASTCLRADSKSLKIGTLNKVLESDFN